ncbi:MAG: alpha/beta hydrolase, partial [Ruminococcus sp.]|nr:alpha/beta hydrolase [Ruminococcus sp.]
YSLYLKFYKWNILKCIGGINYSVKHLTPKMKENDVIPEIHRLDVPIILISGEKDYICPVTVTEKWFENLQAPGKEMFIIKNASHMVNFEQPEEWNRCVKTSLDLYKDGI